MLFFLFVYARDFMKCYFFFVDSQLKVRGVLDKYDDDADGGKRQSFKLGKFRICLISML